MFFFISKSSLSDLRWNTFSLPGAEYPRWQKRPKRTGDNAIITNLYGGSPIRDAEQVVWSPLAVKTAFSTGEIKVSHRLCNPSGLTQENIESIISWGNPWLIKYTKPVVLKESRMAFETPWRSEPSRNGPKSTTLTVELLSRPMVEAKKREAGKCRQIGNSDNASSLALFRINCFPPNLFCCILPVAHPPPAPFSKPNSLFEPDWLSADGSRQIQFVP